VRGWRAARGCASSAPQCLPGDPDRGRRGGCAGGRRTRRGGAGPGPADGGRRRRHPGRPSRGVAGRPDRAPPGLRPAGWPAGGPAGMDLRRHRGRGAGRDIRPAAPPRSPPPPARHLPGCRRADRSRPRRRRPPHPGGHRRLGLHRRRCRAAGRPRGQAPRRAWPRPRPRRGALTALDSADLSDLDPRLRLCRLEVVSDVDSPLLGRLGAAHVFGPQKGATGDEVDRLAAGLRRLAEVLERDAGVRPPSATRPARGRRAGAATGWPSRARP